MIFFSKLIKSFEKKFQGNKRLKIYCETSSLTWNINPRLLPQRSYKIDIADGSKKFFHKSLL